MKKNLLILGLGSNVGDRQAMLNAAIPELVQGQYAVMEKEGLRLSRIYESPAVLPEAAPDDWDRPFLNAAVAGYATRPAEEILPAIKEIEKKLGRIARGFWGPREIDIDIIGLGDEIVETDSVTIPHCRLLERDFVLIPVAEVAAEWKFPSKGSYHNNTAAELAGKLAAKSNLKAVGKLEFRG